MRRALALLTALLLAACSKTVLVTVPPRMDLGPYATLGVVEFDTGAGYDAQATKEFQAQVHAAQPGTRLLELGSREKLLAEVGSREADAQALKKIGVKYGVDAVFLGEVVFAAPKTDVRVGDLTKLEGAARTVLRGDANVKLLETRSGASVWSSSAWATREIGRVQLSTGGGVSGGARTDDPRGEMVQKMMFHLAQDLRAGTARRRIDD